MEDITKFFISIIEQTDSLDIAESEFRRALVDDEDLKRRYREYCQENGYSEKKGFEYFCEEYMHEKNSVWDSLNDYDEQY